MMAGKTGVISMQIAVSEDCREVDWEVLMSLLKRSGMGTYTPGLHRQAFENSRRAVFIYDCGDLIGCGRLLSDGAYQGAIYDVAVDERYRGQGIGRRIMDELVSGAEGLNLLLYASPGKESFYEKFGFERTKTGMVRFLKPDLMREKGLI